MLRQLYNSSNEGAYWYTAGVNWRAMGAWFVCFAPAMPGMIANLNPNVRVSQGAYNYYLGNYLFGM